MQASAHARNSGLAQGSKPHQARNARTRNLSVDLTSLDSKQNGQVKCSQDSKLELMKLDEKALFEHYENQIRLQGKQNYDELSSREV